MIIFVGEIRLTERTLKVRGPMKDENMHKRAWWAIKRKKSF